MKETNLFYVALVKKGFKRISPTVYKKEIGPKNTITVTSNRTKTTYWVFKENGPVSSISDRLPTPKSNSELYMNRIINRTILRRINNTAMATQVAIEKAGRSVLAKKLVEKKKSSAKKKKDPVKEAIAANLAIDTRVEEQIKEIELRSKYSEIWEFVFVMLVAFALIACGIAMLFSF